jgi:hypothetical protein
MTGRPCGAVALVALGVVGLVEMDGLLAEAERRLILSDY